MSPFDAPAARYMTSPVVTIHPDAALTDAAARMKEAGVSCLGVVGANGALTGMISQTDLVRVGRLRAALAGGTRLLTLPRHRVRDWLTAAVIVVERDTPLCEAAARMASAHVHRVFVVEGERPIGVLSTTDVMRAVVDSRTNAPLSSCATAKVITVEAGDPLGVALHRLVEARVHGLVVTESGWPVGLFTQREALAAGGLDPRHPVEEAMSCAMLCLPARTPLHRAAALALETGARRVLSVTARTLSGIASGLDLARVAAAGRPTHRPGPRRGFA